MRTARMVGYSLTTLDEQAMWELAAVLRVRLADAERRFLAASTFLALDREGQDAVLDFAEGRCP
ncbi:hypothetical protein [Silicimonas algicola]|nr:hypothetical protein [Silicimonas algicola]